jgi:hypothetical protein
MLACRSTTVSANPLVGWTTSQDQQAQGDGLARLTPDSRNQLALTHKEPGAKALGSL